MNGNENREGSQISLRKGGVCKCCEKGRWESSLGDLMVAAL